MHHRNRRMILSAVLCTALGMTFTNIPLQAENSLITIDGDTGDWSAVPEQASSDPQISWWKAARDTSGDIYLVFGGQAVSQWDGAYERKIIRYSQYGGSVDLQTASIRDKSEINQANGNTPGPYIVELKLTASDLPDYYTDYNRVDLTADDYVLSFAGTDLDAADIPVLDQDTPAPTAVPAETPAPSETPAEEDAAYHGITIDGDFNDWKAVTKVPASCPNSAHPDCLTSAAMVFDGDYVYLYVEEGEGQSAAGAGSHSNGMFAITTDLGYHLVLRFDRNGTVTSDEADNIISMHVGREWEAAVPKIDLPHYLKTISFGLYSADADDPAEPFVKDAANMNGSGGNVSPFNGITYDGNYGDWDVYPHTLIEYATAGTQEERGDAGSALYSSGDQIFGHVFTEMPAHLQEHGGEFAQAVTIRVNQDDSKVFYPRLVQIDQSGNINRDPDWSQGGEFYIIDTHGWSTAKTLADLNDGKHGNAVYGKMTMTLDPDHRDECEYYIDADQLAKKFGIEADEIRYIEAQFSRIGQQWVGCSGASSGPLTGLALCLSTVGLVWFLERKKYHTEIKRSV